VVLSGASDNAALGLVPEPAAILPARSGRKTGPLQSYQSPPLVAETTQVIFDPRIKDRSPTNLPALPVWRGQQLPLRTRIELSIDPWGYVAGLHVAESSGSKEMDNLGSEVVRQWRFRPAFGADFDHPYNPASLARGIVTLNWAPAPVETR
jgi:TonB family protein